LRCLANGALRVQQMQLVKVGGTFQTAANAHVIAEVGRTLALRHRNVVTPLGWTVYPYLCVPRRTGTHILVEGNWERHDNAVHNLHEYVGAQTVAPLKFRQNVETGSRGEILEFRLVLFTEMGSRGALMCMPTIARHVAAALGETR
jgi:hypothetical protein